jgi:hypothetical protein
MTNDPSSDLMSSHGSRLNALGGTKAAESSEPGVHIYIYEEANLGC